VGMCHHLVWGCARDLAIAKHEPMQKYETYRTIPAASVATTTSNIKAPSRVARTAARIMLRYRA